MNHQEIEITNLDGTITKHIIVETAPDEFRSFPADENNPEYVAWLKTQETNKPAK